MGSSTSVSGFSIECMNGDVVSVSPRDAAKLQDNCEYFRTVFEHGTTETQSQRIVKPDWSSDTTKRLIELISTGTASATSCYELSELAVAANQVLYDFELWSSLEDSSEPLSTEVASKIIELSKTDKFVFELRDHNASRSTWLGALKDRVYLDSDWYVLSIIGSKQSMLLKGQQYKQSPKPKTFCVHADCAAKAIRRICFGQEDEEDEPDSVESATYRLIFPCLTNASPPSADLKEDVAKKTGNRALVLKSSYVSGSTFCHYELIGRIDDAANAFLAAKKHLEGNRVTLVLDEQNPSSAAIASFVNASLKCVDHKGSLGWNVNSVVPRRLVMTKTISDMAEVLEYLRYEEPSTAIEERFMLVENSVWKETPY